MRNSSEKRRDQIAKAVLEILARDGPQGVTAANVASAVGVVPSALYRHFASLEEMIEAALDEFQAKLGALREEIAVESQDPLDYLRIFLMRSSEVMPMLTVMPRLLFFKTDLGGNYTRWVGCLQERFLDDLSKPIEDAQKEGRVRRDMPAHTLAMMFWGILAHSFLRWVATEGEFDVKSHVEKVWPLYLDMISPINERAEDCDGADEKGAQPCAKASDQGGKK